MEKDNQLKLPIYARASIFLIGAFVLIWILYIARSILEPLVFATIIAVLLHPVVNFLVRKKINRVIAIVIALTLTIIVITAFCILLFSQMSRFTESWPLLVDRFTETLNQATSWFSGYFEIRPRKVHAWILETKGEIINTSTAAIGKTLLSVGGVLVVLLLVPVYVFMILFYQPLLMDFVHKLFSSSNQSQVAEVISQIKTVIQRYLVGLIIEATMIAILNISALLIIGIEYAVLLGIIGALVNLIPYIGGLVGVALPMMVALATKSSAWYAIYVMLAYYFIQLVDNNYIVPKIVSSKVKINALFSIIVVIVGNAIWGIPGMFLSIPILAIVKLIFDHIEGLKPWGFLLGDTMPPLIALKPILKKLKIKSS